MDAFSGALAGSYLKNLTLKQLRYENLSLVASLYKALPHPIIPFVQVILNYLTLTESLASSLVGLLFHSLVLEPRV